MPQMCEVNHCTVHFIDKQMEDLLCFGRMFLQAFHSVTQLTFVHKSVHLYCTGIGISFLEEEQNGAYTAHDDVQRSEANDN